MNGFLLRLLFVSIWFSFFCSLHAQNQRMKNLFADSICVVRKKPFKAAVEVTGLNLGIWAYDRYGKKADYAYINWNSMKRNIRNGFVWDNDAFLTNLFGHPYHGGLYFNAARSNGMLLREAALYTVGGSLMWEYLMENELPSMNDLIATSIGGVCLGEITFRLSDLLIDDRTIGLARFGREFFATLISPMRGFNRIISGDAWKVRNISGRRESSSPVRFYIASGYKSLSESRNIKLDHGMYIDLKLLYSNIFSDENEKPYDAFLLNTQINFFSYQPFISNINVLGQIWGKNIRLKNNRFDLHWGFFQHFDYYDSKAVFEGETINSYKISQVAAVGVGGQFRINLTEKNSFVMSSYLNGVLLGGSITDYYRVTDRDYNMGSGFSAKANMWLRFGTKAELAATIEKYRFFTWKGYDPNIDLSQLTPKEQSNLNVQGDKGSTDFTVSNLNFNYCFLKQYTFSIGMSYYLRNSNYIYFPDVKNKIIESKVGAGYTF